MKTARYWLLASFLLVISPLALAWGPKGHRIIAMVASERLLPATRASVTALLGTDDLAAAATWADEMRSSTDNPSFWADHASQWHFVNLVPGSSYADSPKNVRGDAIVALETFTAILLDEPLPDGPVTAALGDYFPEFDQHSLEAKRFALKFALHIIGDLQQPLHAGYADDRGGNAVTVVWQGESTNLHSLWDSKLLDYGGIEETAYARRLRNRIDRTPNSDIGVMERSGPLSWLDESSIMLERIHRHDAEIDHLGHDYAAQFVPTVESQLVKGALRTAWYLNNLFGGWPVATAKRPAIPAFSLLADR